MPVPPPSAHATLERQPGAAKSPVHRTLRPPPASACFVLCLCGSVRLQAPRCGAPARHHRQARGLTVEWLHTSAPVCYVGLWCGVAPAPRRFLAGGPPGRPEDRLSGTAHVLPRRSPWFVHITHIYTPWFVPQDVNVSTLRCCNAPAVYAVTLPGVTQSCIASWHHFM